jgi:hypothetical protein
VPVVCLCATSLPWSCDSSVCNSGFLVRFSYIWALQLLNYLHSRARDFSLSTALRAVSSLRSLTSCRVLGTVCSSKFAMRCCSCWITSSSCTTCYGTHSSIFTSTTFTERSYLLTISFTSSFSASKFSLICCSCSFSSSHFTWREIFSHSAVLSFSIMTPCTCDKAWVACIVSSCARRRRASTVSTIQWS